MASNSKVSSLIKPEIKLVRALMPVLVTSNFDDDSIGDTIFPLQVYGNSFGRSKAANSVVSGPIWPKFELVRYFMHVLVTCEYKKRSDQTQPRKGGEIVFLIISQWGLSAAVETRVLIQSAPQPYAACPPSMLHVKFDQDWPTGFRDIQV